MTTLGPTQEQIQHAHDCVTDADQLDMDCLTCRTSSDFWDVLIEGKQPWSNEDAGFGEHASTTLMQNYSTVSPYGGGPSDTYTPLASRKLAAQLDDGQPSEPESGVLNTLPPGIYHVSPVTPEDDPTRYIGRHRGE